MLGEHGDTIAEADRSAVMTLRGEALGLLTELRTVLRREINARPELPANLEKYLFGTLDALQELAAQRNAKPTPKETADPSDAAS
ncbi:MAG: hypothetical protein HUU55_18160 [Myxococcales bacterium]|nr:hypothetical protein [Myxococcales bacterium]